MYSTKFGEPQMDNAGQKDYGLKDVNTTSYPLVKFTVERKYDTSDAEDFVLPLNTVIRMGYAIRSYSVEDYNRKNIVSKFGGH